MIQMWKIVVLSSSVQLPGHKHGKKRQTVGLIQDWVAASWITGKTRDRDKKSGKVKGHEIWSEKISSKGSLCASLA